MPQFEYKVVPAPKRVVKTKGLKTTQDRFAHVLQMTMNEQAAGGWEYQRTDTLPSEERSGLTGRITTYQNMLVFRREVVEAKVETAPLRVEAAHAAPPVVTAAPLAATSPVVNAPPVVEAPKVTPKPLDVVPDRPDPQIAAG